MGPEIATNSLCHEAARQPDSEIVTLFRVPFERFLFLLFRGPLDGPSFGFQMGPEIVKPR